MISCINNFLSDDECKEYIQLIEEAMTHKNIPFTNTSNNFNHKCINQELANKFLERIFKNGQLDKDVNTANDLIMMAKYNKGENFGIHTDTGLFYDKATKTKTRYTLLVYLNDDFKGGNTVFYTDKFKLTDIIIPKKGSCLLFDIDLWHEGKEVTEGSKYWIGCEIIGPMNGTVPT